MEESKYQPMETYLGNSLDELSENNNNNLLASNSEENITYSVIENFWKLIIEDKLEIKIINNEKETIIDSKNIRGYAQIGKQMNIKIDEHDNFNAYKLIELNDSVEEVTYGSICSENDVELKIAKLPQYPEKKILKMRDTEMKINIFSLRKRPVNFIGILIAKGEELNKQLRDSEPQTHDSWNADNIEDDEDRKKVRNTIKKLDDWMNSQIDSLSLVRNIPEFDAEGLDFLNLEDDDSKGIEEMQKPFDEIVNTEEDEQEILITQRNSNIPNAIDTTNNEEPNIGGEGEGPGTRPRGEGKKPKGEGENPGGHGNVFHDREMCYIKTPYDSEKNMYNIIIKPLEDINECEIRFQRWTDSGELEKLKIEKAFLDTKELEISGNTIKNVKLYGNKDTNIKVIFEAKRKCVMEVKVYVQS